MTTTTNATANKEFVGTCGHKIENGASLYRYRERALSYREASRAGMYPWRHICEACAVERMARIEQSRKDRAAQIASGER